MQTLAQRETLETVRARARLALQRQWHLQQQTTVHRRQARVFSEWIDQKMHIKMCNFAVMLEKHLKIVTQSYSADSGCNHCPTFSIRGDYGTEKNASALRSCTPGYQV